MHDDLSQLQLVTSETNFDQTMNKEIREFWNKMETGTVRTKDKKKLQWCRFVDQKHSKSLLVLNGRVESFEKYRELFFELFKQGYNIYSYDHRGQGLSSRLLPDSQIGYIEWFDDYVDDLHCIVEHFAFKENSNVSILAHSLGCAIALRYLQTYQSHSIFKALVLASPMLGFNIPWKLRPFAIYYSQILSSFSATPKYVKGYGEYSDKPFENNPLSHSKIRYQWYRQLYQQRPELQLGGPGYRWVWQNLMAVKQCYLMTRQIQLPVLIMQAGNDLIVNNSAQDRFVSKLKRTNPQVQLQAISGAKHELFFESDEYRNQALTLTLNFLNPQMDQ